MPSDSEIVALITKRRTQCLIHRYLYYVKSQSLVTDQFYDGLERELKLLVEWNPDEAQEAPWFWACPSHTVGSSSADSYPEPIVALAESLLRNAPRFAAGLKEQSNVVQAENVTGSGACGERGLFD